MQYVIFHYPSGHHLPLSWIISGKEIEFSWMYEFAKGGIGGTIICLLNRHLFLRHPNPKQKKI